MIPRHASWLPTLALLMCADVAASDQITIYRCTDASGALALRDTPCPQGQQQDTLEMQRPQDPPPRPEPPPEPEPAPSAAPIAPKVRVIVVSPPRPMYQCITPDGERYQSDTPEGNPRWVPLWVAGIRPDWLFEQPSGLQLGHRIGAPTPQPPSDDASLPDLPPAIALARTPGRWIRDRCYRLPQAEVCDRLRERRSELRRQYFNAQPSGRDALRPQRRAVDARLNHDCGIS